MPSLVNIKEELKMYIEVCITNLGNGNYLYRNIGSISDIVDLQE